MGDMIEFGVFMGIITTAGLAFRFSGVLIKRMERGAGTPSQMADLEHRIAELEEHLESRSLDAERIVELEERLDFAERLLEQQRGQTRLSAGEGPDA